MNSFRITNFRVFDNTGTKVDFSPITILAANLTEHKIRQRKNVILCSYGERKKISEVQEHSGSGTSSWRVSRGAEPQVWYNDGGALRLA